MTAPNPFTPPAARVEDAQASASPSRSNAYRYAFGVVLFVHVGLMVRFWPLHFELVRTGATNMFAFLAGIVGTGCLYVASVFVLRGRRRGRAAFVVGAVALAFAVGSWGPGNLWSWPFGLGLILSVWGAVLTRPLETQRGPFS
jgi:hypothetical protein